MKKRGSILNFFSLVFSVLILALSLVISYRFSNQGSLNNVNYGAVFTSALLGSATVFFGGFNTFLVFLNAKFLNPAALAIFAGVGWGLGEGTGYLLGYFGEKAIRILGEDFYQKVLHHINRGKEKIISILCFVLGIFKINVNKENIGNFSFKKHGFKIIFIATLFPNPFIEVFTFTAGATRYSWWKFVLASVAGRTALSFVLVLIGIYKNV